MHPSSNVQKNFAEHVHEYILDYSIYIYIYEFQVKF